MNSAKSLLIKLIEDMPENQIPEVINSVSYLKSKGEKQLFKGLEKVSESSLDFWDNNIDDEVWNNV